MSETTVVDARLDKLEQDQPATDPDGRSVASGAGSGAFDRCHDA